MRPSTLSVRIGLVTAFATLLGICQAPAALPTASGDTNTPITRALLKGNELFEQKNWAEARSAYDVARNMEQNWSTQAVRLAVEGAVACSIKLEQWDDALNRALEFVAKTKGTFEEAVGERFLGGLYLTVPHHGTKSGSTYLRGQWAQGVHVYSLRKDAREAIRHYERARDLLTALEQKRAQPDKAGTPSTNAIVAERIGLDFDLTAALSEGGQYRSPYAYSGRAFWWWWEDGREAEEDSSAVEEADYEEMRWGWGSWGENQSPPTGIPLGPDGKPQFIQTPKNYSPDLASGQKIRFLLQEIQQLDRSEKKNEAARALFRWAMIARTLYGPDSTSGFSSAQVRYDRFGNPLPAQPDPDEPKQKIWELADDQTITIVGAKLRLVTLPASESPLAILREVEQKYPESDSRAEAHYARALYYQTRQQFPEATKAYEAFLEAFPTHKRAADAREQLRRIAQPDVMLRQSSVYLPGTNPKLSFNFRNTDKIEFKALKFDLMKYVQDTLETKPKDGWWGYHNFQWYFFQEQRWTNYLGAEAARWTEPVKSPPGNRVGDGSTAAPFTEPGAWLIEASVSGRAEPSRVLVLVTDIALVHKNVDGKGLLLVCDARNGQPLQEKSVRLYEHWSVYNQKDQKNDLFWDSTTATTDTNGVILYSRRHANQGAQVDAVTSAEGGRMAFSFFQNFNESAGETGEYWENGPRYYTITDRPVYRPGTMVHFRVWARYLQNRQYAEVAMENDPQTGIIRPKQTMSVELYDAKNTMVKSFPLNLDEFGAASGEYTLGEEPPLGVWHLRINGQYPDAHHSAGSLFRVEEYKKPEFEVTVKPAKSQARLGEKIKATIEARYYFGAPVAKATVSYKVFREDYHHVYFGPGEYDWLYGKGYGRYCYAYPWLPWWGRWGKWICWEGLGPWPGYYSPGWWLPWGGYYGDDADPWRRRYESGTRKALRELVAKGEGKLSADGSFELEIDTARAKAEQSDRDHRYTVEAEVRDESRRTIEGQGSVLATRQEFYAFVETDGGWYQPKNEAFVEVRTLAPDNQPVTAAGEVVVKRISYKDGGAPEETVVKRWDAETDPRGRLSFRYPIPAEGQYRITFVTRDSTKAEVQGNAVFWVNGPKFDGRIYRFNDLEIIADKRNYKVGDTAHLLVNVAENDSRILFADHVSQGVLLNWSFINLPSRSTVIDVPIEAKHVPNFFVEATLVRDGRVHTEARELFVPPVHGLLNVALRTDKPIYRPGETGKVSVAVTDMSGEPVRGQVALTAYDRAVTYIQDEFGPSPRVFFYVQKRHHSPFVQWSGDQTFGASGNFERPEYSVAQGGEPDGWRGTWRLEESGLSLSDFEINGGFRFAGGGGGGAGGAISGAAKALNAPFALPASRAVHALFADSTDIRLEADRKDKSAAERGAAQLLEPEIRVDFSDTAVWLPALNLDASGKAEAEIRFPQSLTTWRLHGYAITKATQVGDSTNEVTATKNLLVRLEAPRFFVERDEVVLSANVHNYLSRSKKVRAELILPGELFTSLGEKKGDSKETASSPHPSPPKEERRPTPRLSGATRAPGSDGMVHLFSEATLAPNSEHRFDWPVRVQQSGLARITVKALTDEESDGMRLAFPVLVHGINKTIAQSGSYRVTQQGERSLEIELPKEIDPEQTRLQVTLSPSLAGVMIDALPYLAGYPYGCVEQTMSRFYPSVLVKDTLKKMGTDLESLAKQRKQMNPGDLTNRFGWNNSPVFDSAELDRMVRAGLDRIYFLQRNDGGWGWWKEDDSSPYQTAYVLQGLRAARDAAINVDSGVFERGLNYLQNTTEKEITKPKDEQHIGALQTQVYIAYILANEHRLGTDELKKWFTTLYYQRGELNNYGRALLALALAADTKADDAKVVLRNLLQFVDRDDSNETAWVRTPGNYWWFWWNNDIEANAWTLKAMAAIDPQNDLAPRLVKWLLNNRRNGYYWRSTRDTALVIAAMTDYMRATGESAPDYSLVVNVDDRPMKEVRLTKENFFTFDNQIQLHGLQLKPGPHKVTFTKNGKGALYYSAYLSYFTKEEDVKGAGNEIFVDRQYFKLVPKTEEVTARERGRVPGFAYVGADHPAGQSKPEAALGRTELRDAWTRVPLKNGDTVASRDRIEVVLKLTAKNTYDYLAFEDMKPAGCEPVELRSGGRWAGGLCANLELRDEKVVFFIGLLEQGQHILRYKLRAETPGQFHALPTKGFAMYAPEVRAISDEMRLRIKE